MMTPEAITQLIAVIATRDDKGRHFTELYSDEDLAMLEQAGLVEIHRPWNEHKGIPCSKEDWTLEVTETGRALVDSNAEFVTPGDVHPEAQGKGSPEVANLRG